MTEQAPIENTGFKDVKAKFELAKETEQRLKKLGVSVKDDIEYAYTHEIDDVARGGNDIEVEVETAIVEGRVVLNLKCTFLPDDVPESYISPFGSDVDASDEVRDFVLGGLEEPGVSKNVVNIFREFLSQYFSSDDFLGMGEVEQLKELGIIIGSSPKLSFNMTSKIPDGYDNALIDLSFEPSIKVELDDDTNTEYVEVFVTL